MAVNIRKLVAARPGLGRVVRPVTGFGQGRRPATDPGPAATWAQASRGDESIFG